MLGIDCTNSEDVDVIVIFQVVKVFNQLKSCSFYLIQGDAKTSCLEMRGNNASDNKWLNFNTLETVLSRSVFVASETRDVPQL
jgi:hypothetical protein